MIICMGYIRFAEGDLEKLKSAMEKQVLGTRAEEGCEYYSYSIDLLDPNLLLINERWRDEASMAPHFHAPHVKEFSGVLRAVGFEELSVKAYYENGEVRTLF